MDLGRGLEVELTDFADELEVRERTVQRWRVFWLEQLGRWQCHLLRPGRFEKERICRGGHRVVS